MLPDADPPPLDWKDHALVVACGLAACALYVRTLTAGWHFEVFCLRGDWSWFRVGESAAYRYSPLGNVLIGSCDDPHALRVLFLALHSLTAALVARTALNLRFGKLGALAAAVVFLTCVHHTEAVVWMGAATYYVPMTALVASSTAIFTSRLGRSRVGSILVAVLGGLAVFFQEEAAALPFLLLALAWARSGSVRRLGRAWWAIGGVALAAGFVAAIKLYSSIHWGLPLGIHSLSWLERAESFGQSLLFALPVPVASTSELTAVVPLIWMLGLGALRRRPIPFVLWLCLGVSLIPSSFFSQPQARYLYMPSLWMALLFGSLASTMGSAAGVRSRVAVVVALVGIAAANLWDFAERQSAWIQGSVVSDTAAEQIVRTASEGNPTATSVAAVDFPDLLQELRQLQRASMFRGCFVDRLEYEAALRGAPMQFEVVRTAACVNCCEDLPLVTSVEADRCFTFDRARMSVVAGACPGELADDGDEVGGAPPEAGRISGLAATASGYSESALNDFYVARHAIDGDPSSEWLAPDSAAAWLEISLPKRSEIREVWIRNAHNAPYADRAARVVSVRVLDGGGERYSATLRFRKFSDAPSWRKVAFGPVAATRVRLEVTRWHRKGGGIAEVVLR